MLKKNLHKRRSRVIGSDNKNLTKRFHSMEKRINRRQRRRRRRRVSDTVRQDLSVAASKTKRLRNT